MTSYTYDSLQRLSAKLNRPIYSLIVQGADADPFYAGLPMRLVRAEWFKKIWDQLGIQSGAHLRRVHYRLISKPIALPEERLIRWKDPDNLNTFLETTTYLNNRPCWQFLGDAASDARYLGLVPIDFIVDARNAETIVNAEIIEETAARLTISDSAFESSFGLAVDASVPEFPDVPCLNVQAPSIDQRFLIELWIEKSTVDDVLAPLAQRWNVNFTSGTGDISITRCHDLIQRARQYGKPVRVLLITDFDPGGFGMPVSLARKLEFLIRSMAPDLDLQVRPIALTPDQIRKYRLPRNAIKESVRQAAEFERKFGAGATELDALEALHPGALRKIVEREIKRYVDLELEDNIRDVQRDVQDDLDEISASVEAENQAEIDQLTGEHEALAEEIESYVGAFRERFEAKFRGRCDDLTERTEALFQTTSLEAQAPDLSTIEWPEPDEGDEDPDPLFDSTRDYVEQVDRFKEHQQKRITRRPRAGNNQYTARSAAARARK